MNRVPRTPGLLRAVKRRIGVRQDIFGHGILPRFDPYAADAGRDLARRAIKFDRLFQSRDNPFGDLCQMRAAGNARQQQGKFVTADAGDGVDCLLYTSDAADE